MEEARRLPFPSEDARVAWQAGYDCFEVYCGTSLPRGNIAVLHPLCFLDRLGVQNLGGLYEDMSEGECDALINGFFSAAGNAMRLNPN
jgi:hypothetical protein